MLRYKYIYIYTSLVISGYDPIRGGAGGGRNLKQKQKKTTPDRSHNFFFFFLTLGLVSVRVYSSVYVCTVMYSTVHRCLFPPHDREWRGWAGRESDIPASDVPALI